MSELKLQQCRLDGRYDVLECLGRGSFSEVYVARDAAAAEGQPRTVVIKALNTHLGDAPDADLERTLIENFRNEAIALDRVRHPNIISRLGHGTAIDLQGRTFHYLVLEYLSGGDLQALVRNRPLPLEGALFYLEQVCNGLAYAHKHDVIHRDIKPQNLLLTADQHTIKIADFGVAKIEAAEGMITRVGTEIYAAPEHHPHIATGPLDTASLSPRKVQLTPAADIYALAKTTYMLLTGEAPRRFSRRPLTELPAEFAAQEWSGYVLRVLERATQNNPERRQQSVEEFWREIKDATMARTRLLRNDDGAAANGRAPTEVHATADAHARSNSSASTPSRGLATPPPLAPTFDREARARDNTGRHRFVVPISGESKAREVLTPEAGPVEGPRARDTSGPRRAVQPDPPPLPYPSEREPRLSSAAKRWLVAFALLLAFSGMLYATYRYVNNMRNVGGGQQQQSGQQGGASRSGAQTGDVRLTTTDVKLRGGPGTNYDQVGLAENGSRVKVIQVSGKWAQVQVIEHARPKVDPDSKDQGWVNGTLLRAQ
ncbi:MAG TPA: serine/threonine protein kinase [Pyrinomonadaceae bacterium]|jgi:serine/threonine protein kinase|nr:serine/threonine protein kinase [Pyrinomonadaceae bacterium]